MLLLSSSLYAWTVSVGIPLHHIAVHAPSVYLEGDLSLDFSIYFEAAGDWYVLLNDAHLDLSAGNVGKVTIQKGILDKNEDGTYRLHIKSLKMGAEALEDISIVFSVDKRKVRIIDVRIPGFGESFSIRGECDYRIAPLPGLSMAVSVNDLAVAGVQRFFAKSQDVSLDGLFSGNVELRCSPGQRSLQGRLWNTSAGVITITGEAPFLKEHMGEEYYRLLIENFRNYQYNKGDFRATTIAGDVSLKGHFESEQGNRDIEIVLHDVFGKIVDH